MGRSITSNDFSYIETKPAPAQGKSLAADLGLRGAGLALVLLSIAAIHWLTILVHAGGRHEGTPLELLLALVGFVGASIGSGLLMIGAHIHDPIEVSGRWRRRF